MASEEYDYYATSAATGDAVARAFAAQDRLGGGGADADAAAGGVSVVAELERIYRADPQEAVLGNVHPYEDAEDVRRWNRDGRLDGLVAWHERAEARAAALERNREYVFIERVAGLAHMVLSTRTLDDDAAATIPVVLTSGVTAARAGVPGAFERARAEGVLGEDEEERRRARDREISQAVQRVLDTTGVTGRFAMPREMVAACSEALTDLAGLDPARFDRAVRGNFYASDRVMTLFAKLVAAKLKRLDQQTKNRHYMQITQRGTAREHELALFELVASVARGVGGDYVFDPARSGERLAEVRRRVRDQRRTARYG